MEPTSEQLMVEMGWVRLRTAPLARATRRIAQWREIVSATAALVTRTGHP